MELNLLAGLLVKEELKKEQDKVKNPWKREILYIVNESSVIDKIRGYRDEPEEWVCSNQTVWFDAMTHYFHEGRLHTRSRAGTVMSRTLRNAGKVVAIQFPQQEGEVFDDWSKRALMDPVMSILVGGFRYVACVTNKQMSIQ